MKKLPNNMKIVWEWRENFRFSVWLGSAILILQLSALITVLTLGGQVSQTSQINLLVWSYKVEAPISGIYDLLLAPIFVLLIYLTESYRLRKYNEECFSFNSEAWFYSASSITANEVSLFCALLGSAACGAVYAGVFYLLGFVIQLILVLFSLSVENIRKLING